MAKLAAVNVNMITQKNDFATDNFGILFHLETKLTGIYYLILCINY